MTPDRLRAFLDVANLLRLYDHDKAATLVMWFLACEQASSPGSGGGQAPGDALSDGMAHWCVPCGRRHYTACPVDPPPPSKAPLRNP